MKALAKTSRIRIVPVLGVLFASLALVLSAVMPASAHDELLRSTPGNGEALKAAPPFIGLQFSEPPLKNGAKMRASTESGTQITLTNLRIAGSTVLADWPAKLPGGTYTIAWRVVSSDGHPQTGTFSFSYTVSGVPSPDVSALADSTQASDTQPASAFPWWLVAVGILIVIGVIVIWVGVRRNREPS